MLLVNHLENKSMAGGLEIWCFMPLSTVFQYDWKQLV